MAPRHSTSTLGMQVILSCIHPHVGEPSDKLQFTLPRTVAADELIARAVAALNKKQKKRKKK